MKISLIRVPTIVDSSASTAPICPPLGLAYIKAIIKDYSKDIHVIDSIGNFPQTRNIEFSNFGNIKLLGQTSKEICDLIPFNTDIILVSIMFSQDWPYAKEVIADLKIKCPNSVLIAGGEHITAAPEFSMNTCKEIDTCVLGEGEIVIDQIFKSLIESGSISNATDGIAYRDSNEIKLNPRQNRQTKLETIPWPDWEGFPLENYFNGGHGFGVTAKNAISMPILASRGCPYRCTFCSNELMWTTRWNSRKVLDVIEEMKYYIRTYHVTNFDFYDLTVIVKKSWIVEFCKTLIEQKLNITWQLPSGTRSEAIDLEVSKLLFESGCRNLSYAPESGSPEILRIIKKKINLDEMLKSMQQANTAGLSIKANIICGFPEENLKHLIESYFFILKMAWVGCDDMSINQFSPYPGSELFEDLRRENKVELSNFYFNSLSFYSSMTNAESYSKYLTSKQLILFKFIGTASFYLVCFLRRPWRLFKVLKNTLQNNETTRLEKTLISLKLRFLK